MTPEEEFERSQAEGRARERKKTFYKTTSLVAAILAFFLVFVPLVNFETTLLEHLPFLEAFGRRLFLLFGALAAIPAGFAHRYAGGKRLKEIEAWERARDDL